MIQPEQEKTYDCDKCIVYCCSIYDRVLVRPRDLKRLAKHFNLTEDQAARRFTKLWKDERVLRRRKDNLFATACAFLDQKTRRCTIYEARPQTCREYPNQPHCAYYNLLEFERTQQGDPDTMPLVQIMFRT